MSVAEPGTTIGATSALFPTKIAFDIFPTTWGDALIELDGMRGHLVDVRIEDKRSRSTFLGYRGPLEAVEPFGGNGQDAEFRIAFASIRLRRALFGSAAMAPGYVAFSLSTSRISIARSGTAAGSRIVEPEPHTAV